MTSARSDVIYSTFGDPIPTQSLFVGTLPPAYDAYTVLQAAVFTASFDVTLDSIEFSAFYYQGLNTLDVIVMSDSGGKPGSALETLTISNLGGLSTSGTIYTVNSSGVTLTAGVQCWVALEAEGNGLFAWNVNNANWVDVARKYTRGYDPGARESSLVVSSQPAPFFEVDGTP